MRAGESDSEGLMRAVCQPFRAHPEYDDLLQEARLAAWRLTQDRPELANPACLAKAAGWAVARYLSGPRTVAGVRHSWVTAGIKPAASLDVLPQEQLPRVADFVPALLHQMEQRAHWEAVRRIVTPSQWEAISLCYGEAIPLPEAAALLGLTPSGVTERIRAGLARYRRFVGLKPAVPKGLPGLPNARKTHCPRGHPLSGANLYRWAGDDRRRCLACHQERGRRGRSRQRSAFSNQPRSGSISKLKADG